MVGFDLPCCRVAHHRGRLWASLGALAACVTRRFCLPASLDPESRGAVSFSLGAVVYRAPPCVTALCRSSLPPTTTSDEAVLPLPLASAETMLSCVAACERRSAGGPGRSAPWAHAVENWRLRHADLMDMVALLHEQKHAMFEGKEYSRADVTRVPPMGLVRGGFGATWSQFLSAHAPFAWPDDVLPTGRFSGRLRKYLARGFVVEFVPERDEEAESTAALWRHILRDWHDYDATGKNWIW